MTYSRPQSVSSPLITLTLFFSSSDLIALLSPTCLKRCVRRARGRAGQEKHLG